ncbi:MAG: Bacterial regulatory protein luxR family [Microbacteriaceae bacterium]|nr:Bacterial regulatory protein luxR family [Microbacteriaceae bacterium]
MPRVKSRTVSSMAGFGKFATLPLTDRERETADLFCSGRTVPDVATSMGISPHSVSAYLKQARRRYHNDGKLATSREQLAACLRGAGHLLV